MVTELHRPQTPSGVVLTEAMNAVIKSFAKHSNNGTVVASEALQEFWDMKWSKQTEAKSIAPILYETEVDMESENQLLVSYVTLPGGSCYGSFTSHMDEKSAKESAARVALMNSVFNEHPSRQISVELIDKILSSVASGKPDKQKKFQSCLDAFRAMLEANVGKSLLMFQEMMTIFQLLHWNGNLKEMKRRQCSREEVISRYAGSSMDQRMRDGMIRDWKSRELKLPGVSQTELEAAVECMRRSREFGTDLRFHKEKRDILMKVAAELHNSVSPRKSPTKIGSLYHGVNNATEEEIQVTI